MSTSVSSSPVSTTEFIKIKTYNKSNHIEIAIIILFLCLMIPSIILLTLIYRQQILPNQNETVNGTYHRILLTNYSQARCMDNSIASYYLRLANNSHSNWLIYFDGGWFCYSNESCEFRRLYSPNLMTSNYLNQQIFINGIFSSFEHYNIIYVPYCSSDLWSGSSNRTNSHGHDIFHAVFHHLNYLLHAKQIIFVGYSAGGLGLLLNLPDLYEKFSSSTDLRVIIDSGWFIDYSNNENGIEKLTQGMTYWNTKLQKSCTITPGYKCLLGSEAIKYFPLKIKVFVIQSLFDLTQLQLDKINSNSYDFSLKLTEDLKLSSSRISIFAPSCNLHGYLFRSLWPKFHIKHRTLAFAIKFWLKNRTKTHIKLIDQDFYSSYCPQIDDYYSQNT